MFLKSLPLDHNNQNYLYSMVKTNNKVASTAKEKITDTINNILTEATKTKDYVWWPEWLPDIIFDFLRLLLVTFAICTIVYFVCKLADRFCFSKTISETTPPLQENHKKPHKSI